MKNTIRRKFLAPVLAAATLCVAAGSALATPSTQIWIPSTDVQPFKTVHLNLDSYIRTKDNPDGSVTAPLYVVGPTVGLSPYEKVQVEAGFDLMYGGTPADRHPFYGHLKVGTPEDSLFKYSPAVAVGGYNFGTKSGLTNQNVVYALAAKTVPVLGRFSAGYFTGNDKVLLDANGNADEKGILLSWDRTLTEISDRIWVGVDYQGSKSALGALSFGASYAFAKNVSVIAGYDVYTEKKTGGQNTATLQVDINFP
jgi:hypothetical protein